MRGVGSSRGNVAVGRSTAREPRRGVGRYLPGGVHVSPVSASRCRIRRPPSPISTFGMDRPENVDRNVEAAGVTLDDADLARLDAGFPVACAAGARDPEGAMAALGREAPLG